jgi:hypothetical protein
MATQAAPHSNDSGIQPISSGQPYILALWAKMRTVKSELAP